MRFLSLAEVLEVHGLAVASSGGSAGIRDLHALHSAVAQPRVTFEGQDLYPSLAEKVAALGYSLVSNHPFVDGNKRVAHAAMATMLLLNGFDITASVDDQERLMLDLAAGLISRDDLANWLKVNTSPPCGGA
jgi:death on curing protein